MKSLMSAKLWAPIVGVSVFWATSPVAASEQDHKLDRILEAFSTYKPVPRKDVAWAPCIDEMERSSERRWAARRNTGPKYHVIKAGESLFHLGKIHYLLIKAVDGSRSFRVECFQTTGGDGWKLQEVD